MSTTSFPSLSSEASTYETSESASSPISIQSTCSSVTSSAIDCRLQRVDIFRSDTRGASSAWHLVFRSRFPDGELDQRYRVIEEESRQVESILRSVGSTEVMGTNNSKVPEEIKVDPTLLEVGALHLGRPDKEEMLQEGQGSLVSSLLLELEALQET